MKKFLLIFILLISKTITLSHGHESEEKDEEECELLEDYYEEAEEMMEKMGIKHKVGQIFIGEYNKETAEKQITEKFIGGFNLFEHSLKNHTLEEMISELKDIQNLTQIRLSLAVDEEGGTVSRVAQHFRKSKERFLSPKEYYTKGGIQEILKFEKEKIDLLKSLSINVNFAPVADIATKPEDFMFKRSLGESPEKTKEYISEVTKLYNDNNLTCCLKHFPGYGNNSDTHTGPAEDFRPLEHFQKNDFIPFTGGIDAKVPMIMVAHNIIHSMGGKSASISKDVITKLRKDLKYSGLIITDDIIMKGIKSDKPAVDALNAGNDIILTSDFDNHYKTVFDAVIDGEISTETLNKACKRVLAWKLKYLLGAKPRPHHHDDDDEAKEKKKKNVIISLAVLGTAVVVLLAAILIYLWKFDKKKIPKDPLVESDNVVEPIYSGRSTKMEENMVEISQQKYEEEKNEEKLEAKEE